VHHKANQALQGETISRASVINFLEDLREMGVLSGEERTGKGGHHWVYYPKLDEAGFKRFIAETLLEKLIREFPGETSIVIKTLNL
jgi:predicted transcriptional regulator